MAKISEEMTAEFVRLRRLGQSFRAIGRQFGADPRTVKAKIEQVDKEKNRHHWEGVMRQVDAGYLVEHYRMLVAVGMGLLEIVRSDPMRITAGGAAPGLIERLSTFGLDVVDGILGGRGVNVRPFMVSPAIIKLGESPTTRLVRMLLDSLHEHEPTIQYALDAWKSCWDTFQKKRMVLGDQAKGLFNQNERSTDEIVIKMAESVLDSELHGRGKGEFQIEELYDGQAIALIVNESTRVEVGRGNLEVLRANFSSYEETYRQLSHVERIRPIKAAYDSLERSVEEVAGLIDVIALRGKPEGRCNLCHGGI